MTYTPCPVTRLKESAFEQLELLSDHWKRAEQPDLHFVAIHAEALLQYAREAARQSDRD